MDERRMQEWAGRVSTAGKSGLPCFFLVDFECERPRFWALNEVHDRPPEFIFPGKSRARAQVQNRPLPLLEAEFIAEDYFRRAFDVVQSGLQRGDSFLTNLTFPTPVTLSGTLEDVFWHSEAKYRVWLPGEFVCFSPETFVTVNEAGYIESRPMKGTAQDTPGDRAALLASQKEIAEHATIVDLIRNDLSQVAKGVRVTDYRYLRRITTNDGGLVQTSSKIGGQLPDNWRERMGDLLLKLLPAGSVSGAPKPATLDLIRRAEGGNRGYYCGIAGYFDGQKLDTCVLIRFIEHSFEGGLAFRSGGGITARSKWEEEYAELLTKIRIPVK